MERIMETARAGAIGAAVVGLMLGGANALAAQPADDCASWAIVGDITTGVGQTAEAVVVSGASVVRTGGAAIVEPLREACVIDLPEGARAYPGLHDGHAHLIGIGLRELTLNLEGTASIAALKERVAEAATDLNEGETLTGRGWIETGWPEGRMPSRDDLDEVVPDRPVILGRADGHAAVVNSAALEAAGIGPETEDPDGGRIERDEDGRATGILIDNAEALVAELMPQLTEERRREALKRGADIYARLGWTAVHNMSVDPRDVDILMALAASKDLPIRVFNYLVPEAYERSAAAADAPCRDDLMVCTSGVKYYVDGALGSRGALLFRPYADAPQTAGLQLWEAQDAIETMKAARDEGVQLAIHAIGDKANSLVLGWARQALNDLPRDERHEQRWRIEHAQVFRPSDLPRVGYYGMIASMQPSHAIGDLFFAPDRLGENRLIGAYAWQSVEDTGARLVFGSDAPVERGDPRIEIYAARQRRGLDGTQEQTWHPEQALGPDPTLAAFTENAAFAVKQENRLGRLAPGYRADVTVFSGDPFAAADYEETEVLFTVVDGQVIR